MGPMKMGLALLDRQVYATIEARRRAADLDERRDILSLLLQARTEEGEALSDKELRDELLVLVLAGHETTADSLAWAWERLLRAPDAHEALLEAARSGEDAEERIEATIVEAMRSRPVIPMIGRRVMAPWQLGEYGVPAETAVTMSILLVHHREDLYPRPSTSYRSAGWAASPGPTSGSPSAAVSAAASAPPWRWPSSASSSRRWPAASTSKPTTPPPSAPATAT